MKTAKFLLCENPIADKSDGRIFILHNRNPLILAEVFHFDIENEELQMNCKRQFTIGSSLEFGNQYIVFGALWTIPDARFLAKEAQKQANELAGIMRRMADWYESYLIWEDQQDIDSFLG